MKNLALVCLMAVASYGQSRADAERLIRQCETGTDSFLRSLRAELNNSKLDGTKREDQLNTRAAKLERAMDDLRREFNRQKEWRSAKAAAGRALEAGQLINFSIKRRNLGAAEGQWLTLRGQLNQLAALFGLRPLKVE